MPTPVETAEILFVAGRVLRVLKHTDEEGYRLIWGPGRKPGGYHELHCMAGDYLLRCDTHDWVTVSDETGTNTVFRVQFIKVWHYETTDWESNPELQIDVDRWKDRFCWDRDHCFDRLMPELDRVLVLEDMSEI